MVNILLKKVAKIVNGVVKSFCRNLVSYCDISVMVTVRRSFSVVKNAVATVTVD